MSDAVVVLLWLASLYRLGAARRHANFISVTFCIAAVGITAAFTIKVTEIQLDRLTSANLSDLLEHMLVVVGGVGAQLFLLALRDGRPRQTESLIRLGTAVAVGVTMIVLFVLAPVHHTETDLDASFGGLRIVTVYRIVFDAYLTYVLIDNVRLCRRYAAVPGDLRRTASLQLVGWGSLIAVGYSASRLVYAGLDVAAHKRATALHTAGSAAAALGLCCIALGVLAPTIVENGHRWSDASAALRRTSQLWRDVTTQFPDLVLATARPISPGRAEHRRDRRLIEIVEGLIRIHITTPLEMTTAPADRVLDLAASLRTSGPPWPTEGGTTAIELLPHPDNRAAEDGHVIRLAAAYRTQPTAGARTPERLGAVT